MLRRMIAAATLAGLLATGAAKAGPISYTVSNPTNGQGVTITDTSVLNKTVSGTAGQIVLVPVPGSGAPTLSLDAWCIDVAAELTIGQQYAFTAQSTPVLPTGPDDMLTAITAKQVGALIQNGTGGINTNLPQSAALQVAIWAIEYGNGAISLNDTTNPTALTDGNITISASSDVIKAADAFIQNVSGNNPLWAFSPTDKIFMLTSPGKQNLIYLASALTTVGDQNTDLPEPASMAVLLFGLAGLATVRQRRRTMQAA